MKKSLFPLLGALLLTLIFFSCKKQSPLDGNSIREVKNKPNLEVAFPGQTGPVLTGKFHGVTVNYMKINGQNVFQGDMIINNLDNPARLSVSSTGRDDLAYKWPGGIIYYTVDPGLSAQYRVNAAINYWSAHTNMVFLPREHNETDYVTFVEVAESCYADVGKKGGQQFVSLETGCSIGNVMHEIGHVVGLWHEQSRNDRDNYVDIDYTNIPDNLEYNFYTYGESGQDGFELYGRTDGMDFSSLMMYASNAFAINPAYPTIIPKHISSYTSQRDSLSEDDLYGIRYMYSEWSMLNGAGKNICIGADGSTYLLGTATQNGGYYIYKKVSLFWSQLDGAAVAIAVAPDGTPWVVNSYGTIFKRVSGAWSQLSGGARDISIGPDGSVYILGTDNTVSGHSIFKYVSGSWVNVPGYGVSIAVAADGNPWIVNAYGNILRRSGSSWIQLPGSATSISVGADGSMYITGTDSVAGGHGVFKWIDNVWRRIGGAGVRVTGDQYGKAWVVNSLNNIYQVTKF